jgi:hypothetical protein
LRRKGKERKQLRTMDASRVEPAEDSTNEQIRSKIYKLAMNRKWKEVCDLFLKNKSVHKENITRDNSTVLHVAISAATEDIILKLLETIENTNSEGIYYIFFLAAKSL